MISLYAVYFLVLASALIGIGFTALVLRAPGSQASDKGFAVVIILIGVACFVAAYLLSPADVVFRGWR